MTDLDKIFITAGVTVIAGVIVYIVGQILSKIFIEPAQEVRKTIAEIRIALAVHAPTIHTPISRTAATSEEAAAALRKCSAELFARVHAIPGYPFLSLISRRFLPEKNLAEDAVRELRALSTYVYETSAIAHTHIDIIRKIVERIERDLGLEPLEGRQRDTSSAPIARGLCRVFVWSFWIAVISFGGLIVAAEMNKDQSVVFLMLSTMVAALSWYVSLGMIAKRLGKSWITWAGLSFITTPIGPLVAFPMMLSHIKAAGPSN